ncbi:MAG: Universal stress protein family protein [Syntrophaceae bacterium PtaU1.Bin231]|nr:MAG: Universal stress protein family protein [Syntrophaceae bacterium PtaU1.Bin231]HOG17112.1 universal stress protein [Syntrophales bacterium]HOI17494.1 universal stress protein [Geobacteraceae bacterium]
MHRKALVPLDGSQMAECALSHVKDFVKDGTVGEVTLLHVVRVDIPWESVYEQRLDIDGLRKKLFAISGKYLSDVQSRLAAEGIEAKTETIESNYLADAVNQYALKQGMDMIFVATHGYTGLKKMLLGSTALQILQQSHVPVYLIRPEACRL